MAWWLDRSPYNQEDKSSNQPFWEWTFSQKDLDNYWESATKWNNQKIFSSF